MAKIDYNYLVSEEQVEAIIHFNHTVKKECPGCIITGFQSISEQSVEVLIQCPDTKYLDKICELSIEIGDQYDMVIVPTTV
ncbi:hypothetical protein FJZ31_24115 [Candidatus Poribacteria bacterium]|nr:hypothetical protein [Candidatus Poribacteria bacterium]